VRLQVVKASLHIKEESEDLVAEAVEGFNLVLLDEGGIGGGSPREGPTLEGVDAGAGWCLGRQAGSYHSLEELGEHSKKDDNPEGGG